MLEKVFLAEDALKAVFGPFPTSAIAGQCAFTIEAGMLLDGEMAGISRIKGASGRDLCR